MTERSSRRTVLRGFGVSLALPAYAQSSPKAPCRMLVNCVPNAMRTVDCLPSARGRDFALPPILRPMIEGVVESPVFQGEAHD